MSMLQVSDLSVAYGSTRIVDSVSFSVEAGQWLMIIGPNGAGKTTVISAISQGVPYTGTVLFEGVDVASMKSRELARCVGVLTQNHYVGYGFTVEEVVRLGSYAHKPGLFAGGKDDAEERIADALEKTGMERFRNQSVLTLSGGELQRAFLAQLFVQGPRMLLLDEPTNHLDLIYQKQVFALVREWMAETGGAVVSVVHDLSLAKAYGTHALLMKHGKMQAFGEIGDVMMPEHINDVYEMDVYDWMRAMYDQWTHGNVKNLDRGETE